MIHEDQDNYKEAVIKYDQSLRIKRELGDKSGIAGTLHHLGMIHQDQGSYEESIKKFKESLGIAKKIGDIRIIASNMGQLGKIYVEKKDYSSALQSFFTAFSIFKKLNSPYAQLVASDLVILRNMMGEEEFNAQLERLVNNNV